MYVIILVLFHIAKKIVFQTKSSWLDETLRCVTRLTAYAHLVPSDDIVAPSSLELGIDTGNRDLTDNSETRLTIHARSSLLPLLLLLLLLLGTRKHSKSSSLPFSWENDSRKTRSTTTN